MDRPRHPEVPPRREPTYPFFVQAITDAAGRPLALVIDRRTGLAATHTPVSSLDLAESIAQRLAQRLPQKEAA